MMRERPSGCDPWSFRRFPMSMMLDDASEFNEPLAFDIAIAKIEAKHKSGEAYRHMVNDELRVKAIGVTLPGFCSAPC